MLISAPVPVVSELEEPELWRIREVLSCPLNEPQAKFCKLKEAG